MLEVKLAEALGRLAAATKNSANSSKPPSSDIVKPPATRRKAEGKRKRGAQPGHPKHERQAFTAVRLARRSIIVWSSAPNLVEQAIHFVVLDRKVTQEPRSLAGRQWSERIWNAIKPPAEVPLSIDRERLPRNQGVECIEPVNELF